ncbi:hypothetical protein LEP1GSC035_4920 [Leptospira noguchii str. 2007001578]|uniref:Uncharacterized protein n=1 Tax=Leptospira noguchii str. 2007001578 TaxID=1049974 RepID=A0ABP2T341_9LEPT|nr:hypothetical protein LEP1GSC035_4920 [Leptospira noguchii str. 2007001578]
MAIHKTVLIYRFQKTKQMENSFLNNSIEYLQFLLQRLIL